MGSLNNGANPAKAGSVVTLYATGQGLIKEMPADGQPAQGLIETSQTPEVFINSGYVSPGDVLYSGLAPGFVGPVADQRQNPLRRASRRGNRVHQLRRNQQHSGCERDSADDDDPGYTVTRAPP